jgi:hypothetical protein
VLVSGSLIDEALREREAELSYEFIAAQIAPQEEAPPADAATTTAQ